MPNSIPYVVQIHTYEGKGYIHMQQWLTTGGGVETPGNLGGGHGIFSVGGRDRKRAECLGRLLGCAACMRSRKEEGWEQAGQCRRQGGLCCRVEAGGLTRAAPYFTHRAAVPTCTVCWDCPSLRASFLPGYFPIAQSYDTFWLGRQNSACCVSVWDSQLAGLCMRFLEAVHTALPLWCWEVSLPWLWEWQGSATLEEKGIEVPKTWGSDAPQFHLPNRLFKWRFFFSQPIEKHRRLHELMGRWLGL